MTLTLDEVQKLLGDMPDTEKYKNLNLGPKKVEHKGIFRYDPETGYNISPQTYEERQRRRQQLQEYYAKYNLGGQPLRKAIFRCNEKGEIRKIDYLE